MSGDDYPERRPVHIRKEFIAKYGQVCRACNQPILVTGRIVGEFYRSRSGKTERMAGPYRHPWCETGYYVAMDRDDAIRLYQEFYGEKQTA